MNNSDSKYIVYALVDPRDDSVRYVGLPDNIYGRIKGHMKETGSRTAKGIWLQDLLNNDLEPTLLVLEDLDFSRKDRHLAEEREIYWINHYLQLGAPLTNIQHVVPFANRTTAYYNVSSKGSKKKRETYTINQLREKAGLWINELAQLANISPATLRQMMKGQAVKRSTAENVLYALSQRLNRRITFDDIRGLRLL